MDATETPANWRTLAACATADPGLFAAPDSDEGEGLFAKSRREKRAVAVCRFCSVREQCAAFAVANDEKWGVWGGMTEWQLAIRRGQARRAANAERELAS